jgi:hypothetical protein
VTAFARILERAVAVTPNPVGGAFAASDGELVDASTTMDAHDWALLTAHYGVILANLQAMLATKHFGGAHHFVVVHRELDVIVHTVADGYYAVVAARPPTSLPRALTAVAGAARELRQEMQ